MRKGFTLIEILVVVAIIGVMMATALVTIASGRGAAEVRDATRGVAQLSRYANNLAVLRQCPVVMTFSNSTISVTRTRTLMPSQNVQTNAMNERFQLAEPIYLKVDGRDVNWLSSNEIGDTTDEEEADETPPSQKEEPRGFFWTASAYKSQNALAQTDISRTFPSVVFSVEFLDEKTDEVLSLTDQRRLQDRAEALLRTRATQVQRQAPIERDENSSVDTLQKTSEEDPFGHAIYETNGRCSPYRVRVFERTSTKDQAVMSLLVSHEGKMEVEDEEKVKARHRSVRLKTKSKIKRSRTR